MFVKIFRILEVFRTILLKPIDVKNSLKSSPYTMTSVIHSVFFLHFSFDLSSYVLFQLFKPPNVFAEPESTVR